MKFLRLVSMLPLTLPHLTGLVLPAAFVASVGVVSGCTTPPLGDSATPEAAFKEAEEFEKDERYEEAIQKFSEVKNKHPYSRFATEAELRIADLDYKREAFIEAQNAYQLFKEFHPKHARIDYVTFRLAMSYFMQLPSTIDRDLTLASKAILYFDETIKLYPNSEFIKEAHEKRDASEKMLAEKELYIADFYMKHEQYDSAVKRYEGALKNYPGLGYDSRALYGAAKSAFESGERDRGQTHLKNLYSLYPSSEEAKKAKDEFKKYGEN
jgi:outer membrane protein assembly factor BamD